MVSWASPLHSQLACMPLHAPRKSGSSLGSKPRTGYRRFFNLAQKRPAKIQSQNRVSLSMQREMVHRALLRISGTAVVLSGAQQGDRQSIGPNAAQGG